MPAFLSYDSWYLSVEDFALPSVTPARQQVSFFYLAHVLMYPCLLFHSFSSVAFSLFSIVVSLLWSAPFLRASEEQGKSTDVTWWWHLCMHCDTKRWILTEKWLLTLARKMSSFFESPVSKMQHNVIWLLDSNCATMPVVSTSQLGNLQDPKNVNVIHLGGMNFKIRFMTEPSRLLPHVTNVW